METSATTVLYRRFPALALLPMGFASTSDSVRPCPSEVASSSSSSSSLHRHAMLSRTLRPAAAVARAAAAPAQQQKQGMATLKEIEMRLKSVRNIEKITKVN